MYIFEAIGNATFDSGDDKNLEEDNTASNDTIDEIINNALNVAQKDTNFNDVSSDEIIEFIRTSTAQREYFKFVFTKSLSFAIELIKQMGEKTGIDVDDLSYLDIPDIFSAEYYDDADKLRDFWLLVINRRKDIYKTNSDLILPPVIRSNIDFDIIEQLVARPNFVTDKMVRADVFTFDNSGDDSKQDLEGKIVCIEQADPGYDWVFSKNIAGLITRFGGVASHMAIRCAEFGVPAAIGCGASLYDKITEARAVILDCKNEILEVKERI